MKTIKIFKRLLYSLIFIVFCTQYFSVVLPVYARESKFTSLTTVNLATNIKLNDPHCGFLPIGCIVHIEGKSFSSLRKLSVFTADIEEAWGNSVPNGVKGFCAPVKGTATLRDKKNTNSVSMSVLGNVCDVSYSSEKLPHNFTGIYTIQTGIGTFKHVAGAGKITGWQVNKNAEFTTEGNISF